jgi:hypothetical protein
MARANARSTAAGGLLSLFLATILGPTAEAEPRSVDRLAELRTALTACWRPPAGSQGSEITLRLALTKDGALRGPPRVTYRRLYGSADRQSAFVAAAAEAIVACTPVALSEHFGRIIAQQVITIRLRGGSAEREI